MLGPFQPSILQSEVIEAELRPILPPCCRQERISVRIPQGVVPHANNLEWHQDGGGPEGTTKHMVIWASESPTELKTSDGALVPIDPGQLVWFDNTRAWHRQPRGTDESSRWFVAIRCSGAL